MENIAHLGSATQTVDNHGELEDEENPQNELMMHEKSRGGFVSSTVRKLFPKEYDEDPRVEPEEQVVFDTSHMNQTSEQNPEVRKLFPEEYDGDPRVEDISDIKARTDEAATRGFGNDTLRNPEEQVVFDTSHMDQASEQNPEVRKLFPKEYDGDPRVEDISDIKGLSVLDSDEPEVLRRILFYEYNEEPRHLSFFRNTNEEPPNDNEEPRQHSVSMNTNEEPPNDTVSLAKCYHSERPFEQTTYPEEETILDPDEDVDVHDMVTDKPRGDPILENRLKNSEVTMIVLQRNGILYPKYYDDPDNPKDSQEELSGLS